MSEDKLLAHMLPQKSRHLTGAWTSIASNWGDGRNYFHWITDNLTRLFVRESLPESARVLLPISTSPYIRETLEILGIAELCESPRETNLCVERFYFCSPVAMSGVWNPLGFDWLRKSFSPCFGAVGSGPAVFLTRRGSNRIPAFLETIEALFRKAGFKILDCGKLTVREQISAVSAAPAIAGIHGAAMTNILWASPTTPVLEVFEPSYLNACYEQIAFQGGLRYAATCEIGSALEASVGRWLRNYV
ncbi:glycosyltransferase family 61 protein [Luteolibacter soli]|uniref:Glycosyltransferase family 61 protein n=1 Tax=Luteolibacter soli TaxID=3135280 RepID=A0ABU9ATE4_9BACT